MYQVKIAMTDSWTHSYETDDKDHIERLKQHFLNKFPIEINEENGDQTLINTDRIVSIFIKKVTE